MIYYFTVGPAALHPKYLEYHNQGIQAGMGSTNHRSQKFRDLYQSVDAELKQLLKINDDYEIYFAGSASEFWERIILNFSPGRSFHFINGAFAQKFYDYSRKLGRNPIPFTVRNASPLYHEVAYQLEDMLICTTQNETSNGTKLSPEFYQSLRKRNPDAIICADLVSSAPLQEIDLNLIDIAFFSVQKAMGMPAGLGVLIVKKSLVEKHKKWLESGLQPGAHHDYLSFHKNYQSWETPSTPNVMAIYCLNEICKDYNRIGIDNLYKQAYEKEKLFEQLSESFERLSTDNQSLTVKTYSYHKSIPRLQEMMLEKGFQISKGYGAYKEQQIRLANFPALDYEITKKMIQELNECDRHL